MPPKPTRLIVDDQIITVREQKVILDTDLAALYGVSARRLNEQVKRNPAKFPSDFVFQLTPKEAAGARTQDIYNKHDTTKRSQNATASRRNRRYRPYAFTEHGAIMAATVLNSPRAVEMSVFIVRAFVRMRHALMSRYDLEKRLDQIEKILLVHDDALKDVYEKLRPLLLPPPEKEPPRIGFGVRESRTRYRTRGSRP